MNKRAIQAWWEIPCKSAIPVFEGLAVESDMNVAFASMYDLSERRRELGWETNFTGAMESEILADDSWQQQIHKKIEEKNRFHVVNGIYQNERIRYLVKRLVDTNSRFGVIMEAPSNLAMGWKRIARGLVAPIVTPLRTRKAARKAKFVLSASGEKQHDFERLGFGPSKIFPFGYFPDFPKLPRRNEPATSLKILCIGWLKPYKGQDYLLNAVAELRARNLPVSCIITGYGSSEAGLRALHKKLNLENEVEFAGVVSNERLVELFEWSNVLVAPGVEEPWGIRINEALLSGLPVVVSDGVGASELVKASGAGEVFQTGSVPSLIEAFERYYARISKSNDVFEATERYRNLIEPTAAGRYLADVIRYVDQEGDGSRSPISRPAPPWLAKQPRNVHASLVH